MTRATILILTLLALLPATAQTAATRHDDPPRKKVAVVLSGGGAFGAVHVGALRVLEEAGMPVDMVVGTSMGGIVGALYSVGYNSDDIATMMRDMDWMELFLETDDQRHLTLPERDRKYGNLTHRAIYLHGTTDPQPGGILLGNKVEHTFKHYLRGYTDSLNFRRDLPRQFACVAADLIGDSAVVLDHGHLAQSIRATMSIPGLFAPVNIGHMQLVDGGTKNNFAADVARAMGADIVIGVKFDRQLSTVHHFTKVIDVVERAAGSDVSHRSHENEKYCDLVIKVPVRGFTSGSFKCAALDSLMARGEKAAREKMDSILALKAAVCDNPSHDYSLHLRDIAQVEQDEEDHYGLIYNHVPGTVDIAMGLRFDTEQIIALQADARWFLRSKRRSEIDATLRLGRPLVLRLGYRFEPREHLSMGLNYEFGYNYTDFYTDGKRSNNLSFIHQRAGVTLLGFDAVNFHAELGLGWHHFHHFNGLWNDHSEIIYAPNEHYFTYRAAVRYDSRNSYYFPTRGVRAEASYEYGTDNFAQWKGHSGFSVVQAHVQAVIPLTHSTHLLPAVQSRLLFGDNAPVMASNIVSGMSRVNVMPQQLAVPGMGHPEFYGDKLVSASLRVQQRLYGRHFLMVDGSVNEQDDDIHNLFDHSPWAGVGLSYFYNAGMGGPLGATIEWNSLHKRAAFIVSMGLVF